MTLRTKKAEDESFKLQNTGPGFGWPIVDKFEFVMYGLLIR